MGKVSEIVKKNFRNFFRFKSNLLLFIFYPLLVLTIFFLVLGINEVGLVNMGYIGNSDVSALTDTNLNLHKYDDAKSCGTDLVYGNIQACLNGKKVVYDNSKSIVYYYLKSIVPADFVLQAYNENTQFPFFSDFIVIIIMFLALFFASTDLVVEKKSHTLMRNKITGTNNLVFLIGRISSAFLLVLIQLVFVLLLVGIFLRTSILTNPYFYLIVLFTTVVFTLIGLLIGYLSNSYQNSAIFSIVVSLILYLTSFEFLSRVVSISNSFHYLSPYSVSYRLLRNLHLANFFDGKLFMVLIAHLLVFGILVWIVMQVTGRNLLQYGKREILDDN